jgi:carbon monoxide dehydrogenase subunit G
MDKLLNEFTVNRPIDETWKVLTDVERIAPCMPGATLEEIEGDVFRGVVKVKLGAISTAFKGQASFVERDDENHRAVLKGEGRDTTGKGNASALITARAEPVDDKTAKVFVETDLHVTGKVAQFGRGIMGDVSKKLMNQFAANLNKMLDQQPADSSAAKASGEAPGSSAGNGPTDEPGSDAPVGVGAANSGPTTTASTNGPATSTTTTTTTPAAPAVRKINGPAAAPIELSDVAGSAILKRAIPLVGGLALLWIIVRRLTRR